ncbi:MAG: DUF433 domain-containing protein [Patescibacteria group bacterium]|nr:DUF433 domain-containing protein [Patescibacteria group bacterium]
MSQGYVEVRDEGYWIAGSRVSLDSVVVAFLDGLSPETICGECFPTLTLEQVYGAIAYYLARREQIDTHLKQGSAEFDALRQQIRKADPDFARRCAEARRRMPAGRP